MLQYQSRSTLTSSSSFTSVGSDCEYYSRPMKSNSGLYHSAASPMYLHNSDCENQTNYRNNFQKFGYNDQIQKTKMHRHFSSEGVEILLSASSSSSTSPNLNNADQIQNQQQNEQVSSEILNEIQRFESVHPCIYAIYNLIQTVPDLTLREMLRSRLVHIEDAFVNSEEWTLSRAVQKLKLGVVGSMDSKKSLFIHYFLTASLTNDESPEGGRYKKEVLIENKSYLLLIRDEGCLPPEYQFTNWIDGVVITFSVNNRESYLTAIQYFKKMTAYRNLTDIPVFFVGILDLLNNEYGDKLQRQVSTEEAKTASITMKMSNYFECYSYKPGVHDIFHSICKKLIQQRRRHQRAGILQKPNIVSNSESVHNINTFKNRASSQEIQQFCSNNSPIGSNKQVNNYYHQRSISALPLQEGLHYYNATPSLPPQPQMHSQLSTNSARNAGSSSVLRRQQQSIHLNHYNQSEPQTKQLRTKNSSSLANVPSSCTSSASTFYQDLNVFEVLQCDVPENNVKNTLASSLQQQQFPRHENSFGVLTLEVAPQYSRSSSNVLANSNSFNNLNHNNFSASNDNASLKNRNFMSTALLNNSATINAVGASLGTPHLSTTPSNTPSTQRKNRRISNIFKSKDYHNTGNNYQLAHTPEEPRVLKQQMFSTNNLNEPVGMGVGREIPIKEGILYKKSHRGLNREWKKKYVCLYIDGRIRYHPTHKDYRNNTDAKEIKSLLTCTVRVCGRQKPRATNRNSIISQQLQSQKIIKDGLLQEATLENNEASTPGEAATSGTSDNGGFPDIASGTALVNSTHSIMGQLHHQELSNSQSFSQSQSKSSFLSKKLPLSTIGVAESKKKRSHKILGSNSKKDNNDDDDDLEFEIISSNQKRWEFSAPTMEERDEWVRLIEEIIERCIQSQQSQKQKINRIHINIIEMQSLRQIPGNDMCADCSQPHPNWASLNLGILICIECSGIHRNLGSHISRVRSLDLDNWPVEYFVVMQAIGNKFANSIWEANAPLQKKPTLSDSRKVKENWIKQKYEQKLYMPKLDTSKSMSHLLIDAVLARDLKLLLSVLPRASEKDVNGLICTSGMINAANNSNNDMRTPLHIACSINAAEILQLLIWYNAEIRALDESNHSALWYAHINGAQECEAILLNAGLEPNNSCCSLNFKNNPNDLNTQNNLKKHSNENNNKFGSFNAGKSSLTLADTVLQPQKSDFALKKSKNTNNQLNLNNQKNTDKALKYSLQGLNLRSQPTLSPSQTNSAFQSNNDAQQTNTTSKRHSDAFQYLPASVI